MEPLYKDFINGEEVKMIKELIKKTNMLITTGSILAYLLVLDLIPKFTITMTSLCLLSLFLTHIIRKNNK